MKSMAAIVMVLVFAMAGNYVHAGQIGAPEPMSKEGRASFGIGYFYSSDKVKPTDSDFKSSRITQNLAYLQFGYSFVQNWEAYVRLGGADISVPSAFRTASDDARFSGFGESFRDTMKPFGTIGVKGVFNLNPFLGIGPFFQASLYSSYKDKSTGTVLGLPATQEVNVKNPYDISLGAALQGNVGGVILYGGPMVYWSRSKVEQDTVVIGGGTASGSTNYKEKGNFGGFAGFRVPLTKGLSFEVEGQFRNEVSGGGCLVYSF